MSSAEDKLLNQLVEKIFVPTVLVRTTPAVEKACLKNNLSFIDMLRPYECITKELYTRTVKEYESYAIKNFRIRFKILDELSAEYGKDADSAVLQQNEKLRKEKAQEQFLQRIVSESYVPKRDDAFITPKLENEERLANQIKQGVNFTPWFDKYREEFINGFYLSDHEAWEHPIACLTVVSSDDPDPVKTSKELYSAEKPPKLFTDRNVDPDLFRFYVMLHDSQNGPADNKVKTQLRKMNEAFTASACRLLQINSSTGSDNIVDIWTPSMPKRDVYNRGKDQTVTIGKYLSNQDISYISVLIDELVTAGIIPSMERKIKSINTTVATKKRGFRGTFSSWFGTKKKEETASSGRYTYQTPEVQIRRMADYCFMLRDYETALSNYKLISSDYKTNKDLKHYAGTMEFTALCTLFYNQGVLPGVTLQVRKEVESSLDTAFSNYNMVGENKYALRTAFFLSLVCKGRGDQKRAAEVYTRSSNLEPSNHLLNALLFEQTAFTYLFYQVPKRQTKKFALFLVLAGHRFFLLDRSLKSQALQLDYPSLQTASHSYRCYKIVLQIHYKKDWSIIFEHMSGVMGDLSLELSNTANERQEQVRFLKDSIQYIHDCIGGANISGKSSTSQGPDEQRQIMNKFLDIVATYMVQNPEDTKSPLSSGLHLPEINVQSYRVLLNQYGNIPSCVHEFPPVEWRNMEESLIRKIRGSFHIFPWERNNSLYKEPTVVFEPVFVEVSVRNNMYIPIRLSNLRLNALFTASSPDDLVGDQEGYKVVPEEVIMKPGQTQHIRLSIIPLVEGELIIKGVSWQLEDVISGEIQFESKGKRLNETPQQKMNVVYEQDNRLCLRVVGNMPLLSVDVINRPTELMHGQIFQSALVLKNVGGLGLKNLKIKVSHPHFIAFGRPEEDKETPDLFLQPFSTSDLDHKFKHDLSIVDLSEFIDNALAPNESLRLPIFFRGQSIGTYGLKLLFYYESEVPNTAMRFRLYKLETVLQVVDTLQLYHFSQPSCVPSNENADEFILGITATNQRRALPNAKTNNFVQINQVSAVSPNWKLTPLNFSPGSVPESMISLAPSESTTLYFKIGKINKSEVVEMLAIESEDSLFHENLFLTDPEYAVNSAIFPHIDFLYRDCVPTEADTLVVDKSPFPFLKDHGLSVMVFWSCGDVRGQSHILNTQFLPEQSTPIQMHAASNYPTARGPNALCPLSVSLNYNDSIIHNFSGAKNPADTMVVVPIVFELSNISPDMTTDLTLELLSPEQLAIEAARQPNQPENQAESAPFLWMGSTRLNFKQVKPSQHIRVRIQACFFGPGKYNLNQFRISWTAEKQASATVVETPDVLQIRPVKRPTLMNFSSMQYLISIDEQ